MCGVASGHEAARFRRMKALWTNSVSVCSAAAFSAAVARTVLGTWKRVGDFDSLIGVWVE